MTEKIKVLVVEDNRVTRELVVTRLRKMGFQVEGAADGQIGIEKTFSWLPDVVLMDLSMPVVDGWTAAYKLKQSELTKQIPIIAITAHKYEEELERAIAAGCDDYDLKPLDFGKVAELIHRHVGRRRRAGNFGVDGQSARS